MVRCPAYRALPALTRALLILIEIEIAHQGGMIAVLRCSGEGERG
jgi:hypothetical protein